MALNQVDKDKKEKILFPKYCPDVIKNLLIKYNLKVDSSEIVKKMLANENFITPNKIIFSLITDVIYKKIDKAKLPSLLAEKLNISLKTSEDLSRDLEEQLINGAKIIKLDNTNTEIAMPSNKNERKYETPLKPPLSKPKIDSSSIISKPISKPTTATVEEKKNSKPKNYQTAKTTKQDSYREPIE